MSTTLARSYRSVLREINKSSIHAPQNRNQAIKHMLRDLYERQASTLGGVSKTIDETSLGFGRNMMEMKEFVKAQRTYNDLLVRYNPLHDMTAEERVKATTRRVGMEQPLEYDDSDPANRENKE
ncbi:hypothetical protein NliqN6_0930 [Naganishia liquefaciens]|uniref:Uncharacterized protein n=1 Tax=Naganishia liquefaciens TaxID=104408 RepID=A0A8H3TPF9_9TREE|nr:hypothetical protein NliqN6_0930 [Naganishia liquefaciens]